FEDINRRIGRRVVQFRYVVAQHLLLGNARSRNQRLRLVHPEEDCAGCQCYSQPGHKQRPGARTMVVIVEKLHGHLTPAARSANGTKTSMAKNWDRQSRSRKSTQIIMIATMAAISL